MNNADNVLLLYAPEDRPEEAEIIIDKSRGGPTGPIRVTFHRNLVRFETYVPPIPGCGHHGLLRMHHESSRMGCRSPVLLSSPQRMAMH